MEKMNLDDYPVGTPLPLELSETKISATEPSPDEQFDYFFGDQGAEDSPFVARLRSLEERFSKKPHYLSEYPSSESEIDMTTRTSLRDILFSYTGDVDATKYRIPAPSQAELQLTASGISYDNGDIDPELASFAISEFPRSRDELMDARDVINIEEHKNVFRRQEELRAKASKPGSQTVRDSGRSSEAAGVPSSSGEAKTVD